MLRLLSIRNFAVVDALEVEFDAGFTVLTGETGAGKSILLDALSLLLGDRFDTRQLRAGAERAEVAAEFEIDEASAIREWLVEQEFGADGSLLLRRVLDSQGRSRAYVNGRPATLAQLKDAGERLVDLHGQHAHQSLTEPATQRHLLDAYGGFATLAAQVASSWRAWREALEKRAAAAQASNATAAEREFLDARRRDLVALAMTADEWATLSQTQSRLAHAASLLEAATIGEDELVESDTSLTRRLSALIARLNAGAIHDAALAAVVAQLEPARVHLDEAARSLRSYRQKLDLDPGELSRVEERLAAIHDVARKHRVRPEQLPELLGKTETRLAALAESADAAALAKREVEAEAAYSAFAQQLSAKRRFAASELANRVSATMKDLAMAGSRFEIALTPLADAASYGREATEFQVATHPKQPLLPIARVASGGELSRVGLAIQVALSDVGEVPTLIFDEVDSGIGGAVAATVGRLLHELGVRRQVLCVTHLPQVAACADAHYRVSKTGNAEQVTTGLARLDASARVEELARMLGGHEITAKTRAHATELLAQNRRPSA